MRKPLYLLVILMLVASIALVACGGSEPAVEEAVQEEAAAVEEAIQEEAIAEMEALKY